MTNERIEALIEGDAMGTHNLNYMDIMEILHDEELMQTVPPLVQIAIAWLCEEE